MANSTSLPAPYKGMNQQDPKVVVSSPQCLDLFNFNLVNGGVSVRPGDRAYLKVTFSPGPVNPLRIIPYDSSKVIFCYDDGNIGFYINASFAHATASSGDDEVHYVYFNGYVYIMGEVSMRPGGAGIVTYNGTTWGTAGYTGWGSDFPLGGNVYKNRAYFLGYQSTKYFYTGIDSITGAVTSVDLSGIIRNKSILSSITPITVSDTVTSEVFLAFVFFSGEVLFYSGSYPDSPSWQLVGRGFIGTPLNYNAFIDVQGDALIYTDSGLFSLRDLFLKGSRQSVSSTISRDIDPYWNLLVKGYRILANNTIGRLLSISGNYDSSNNRIIITMPVEADPTDKTVSYGNTFLIYDMLQQAWFRHKSYGMTSGVQVIDTAIWGNIVLILAQTDEDTFMVWEKEGKKYINDQLKYMDETEVGTFTATAFDFSLLSAAIPTGKTSTIDITGVEPIIENNFDNTINWKLIADFGKQETTAQNTTLQVQQVSKPLINVGMNGASFVQVEITGQTEEITSGQLAGFDMYSYNVWFNTGDKGSR